MVTSGTSTDVGTVDWSWDLDSSRIEMGVVRSATNRGRSASAAWASGAFTRHHTPWPPARQLEGARGCRSGCQALPGGECGGALVRLVRVVEEEESHISIVLSQPVQIIGCGP